MIVVSYMVESKNPFKRWLPLTEEHANHLARNGSVIFEDILPEGKVTAYVLGDGSVVEIIRKNGTKAVGRHYKQFDGWQIERFVMPTKNHDLEDGTYIVEFCSVDDDGNQASEVEGRFVVSGNEIISAEGRLVKELISVGLITPMTLFRINHSFNNGYYWTRLVGGDDE